MKKLFYLFVSVCLVFVACKNDTPITNTNEQEIPKELVDLNSKIVSNPSDASLYHERAKYFIQHKDMDAALNDMQRVMKLDSTKAAYFITLADLYLFINKTGNSKAALEKCLSVDPKNTDAMLKLAELYLYVKKYDRSIEYINKALEIDKYIAKAYFIKGVNYKEMGDTAKAVSSMQTAVEQNPDYYAAYIQLGVIFASKRDPIAIDYYNNALKLNPTSVEALYDKAKFYQDVQDWNPAIETYTMLLKVDSLHRYALFNLGVIHQVNLKVYSEALKYFTKASNADPNYYEAFYGKGTAYESLGDAVNARIAYKTALQINPNYDPVIIALNRLDKLPK